MNKKPILCLDFDGVLHSYSSGWQGAHVIADPPVPGAMDFICRALDHFQIAVHSSRSHQPGGIASMREYLRTHLQSHLGAHPKVNESQAAESARHIAYDVLQFPGEKPPAMVTIDDRAITFTGTFPPIETLLSFKPWNKR